MTIDQGSHLVATQDYTVFYESWQSYIETAAKNWGLTGQDVEDATHDIFESLLVGRYLEKYDPARAEFSTYIWSQVRFRLMSWKKSKARRENVTPAVDLFDSPDVMAQAEVEDSLGDMELEIVLGEVYQQLRQLPSTQTKDLARLFHDLHGQVEMEGKTSTRKLEGKYGIKHQAISEHVKELRKLPFIQTFRAALRS